MSFWKTILENDLQEISTLNYAKMNVIQQEIADFFERNSLSVIEVNLILSAMRSRKMLNKDIANEIYKKENRVLLEIEGVQT